MVNYHPGATNPYCCNFLIPWRGNGEDSSEIQRYNWFYKRYRISMNDGEKWKLGKVLEIFQRIVHTNPNTCEAFYSWCPDRECGFQCTDDHFFKWPKVPVKILFVVPQIENRVHNKLRKQRMECKKHRNNKFTHGSCKHIFFCTTDWIWISNMKRSVFSLWRWVDDQSCVYKHYYL